MSIRRLVVTATAMAGIAVVLALLTPPVATMTAVLSAPQRTVDALGSDVLLSAAVGLLAWVVWAWGAVGLTLTAGSALPGLAGGAARLAVHVVLPAGARRSAALLLGLGLGVAAPVLGVADPALAPVASAAAPAGVDVPDWPVPAADSAPVPDWPTGTESAPEAAADPSGGGRVVVRGDCLWHIAADSLLGELGRLPTEGETATAVHAWWRANADVIGPDPDLLLPGQVLRPPGPP
jgi:nucleoid-associated protein YgaU